MASNLVYDLIEPAVLINYVRAYDNEVLRPELQDSLERFLPNQTLPDLEFRVRRGSLNDQDTAEYRAFDTPAPMSDRAGVSFITGSLGPVSRQIALSEEEFLRSRALLTGTNDPIIDAIYADSERMLRAVNNRIELARGDIINDGKVTIAENGLVLEADFGRSAAHSVTAAVLWTTTATATPLADMLGWTETYVDTNGVDPASFLMSKTRVANLALSAEMRSYAAALGTTPNRINRATIDNILANEGLAPIELYDRTVRVNKTKTRVLPQNKVFLMPPAGESLGNTFWGTTAEALLLASKGYIDAREAPGIVAVVAMTEHPVQTYTVGTAIALPAMPNPDLVLDAVVA